MRYAVIYESKSGNTRMLADEIYDVLDTEDKEIIDFSVNTDVPAADVYFVGFGIHNGLCSANMLDCFEQIAGGKLALFATCGFFPTDSYKAKLEKHLEVWMPDEAEYLGMFLCQGSVDPESRDKMIEKMPDKERELEQMFEEGSCHPDAEDLESVSDFALKIQKEAEHNGEIHIW